MMIVLEPHSGLANRMRVIAGGLWLAQLTGKKVQLIWNENPDLNCPFYDLFKPIDNLQLVSGKRRYKYSKSSIHKEPWKTLAAKVINRSLGLEFVVKDPDFPNYLNNKKVNFIDIAKRKSFYVNSCEELGWDKEDLDYFRPAEDIQHTIDAYCNLYSERTIGLHIRRGDHNLSIKNSPLELFINAMKEELAKDNTVKFFLATDDLATEAELKALFPNKIISHDKELSRNSQQGIKDAVVDLFCLANCMEIYGSFWSSFSNVASRIYNVPIHEMIKKN